MRALALAFATLLCACSSGASDSPSSSSSTPEPTPTPPTPTVPGPAAFTVASYNINAGMSGNRATLAAVAALDSDVIILQEVTPKWWRALKKVHRETHPHRLSQFDKRHYYGGLAILSRFPIRDAKPLKGGPGPFLAWRGLLDTPVGPVQVVNLHLFPPGVWFRDRGIVKAYADSQERHREELAAHVQRIDADVPTIIAGDFNENTAGLGIQWLIESGFEPSHTDNAATWKWKVRGGFEVEFQLDHIMIKGLTATESTIIKAGESDHRPITAGLARAD